MVDHKDVARLSQARLGTWADLFAQWNRAVVMQIRQTIPLKGVLVREFRAQALIAARAIQLALSPANICEHEHGTPIHSVWVRPPRQSCMIMHSIFQRDRVESICLGGSTAVHAQSSRLWAQIAVEMQI